jgi:PiT family inorganic phosphate transporter
MEIIILVIIFGLIFDYTNGFQDASNVVSTVIATKALRPLTAIVLAGVLNTVGATQIGGVAHTITSGLVNPMAANQTAILCAVFGAIIWNVLTWYFGIPSSSSYALIGGLIGTVLIHTGMNGVIWKGLITLVIIPMVVCPFIGFSVAHLFMRSLSSIAKTAKSEKFFRVCQIGSSSLVAIAHGLNDAQKSMGIITLGLFTAGWIEYPEIPLWVVLACALMMGLGTATGGFRIIQTVGFKITKLEPAQGFAAETSASFIILIASFLGMPVSSTHMIVGSVAGVGSTKGYKAVNWLLAHKLAITWVLTLPGAALIASLAYFIINFIS